MPDAPADPFGATKANLRDTVKWLAAAFAGVAGLAVGTSPLTSLGSFQLDDPRLWVAAAALAVGVICFIVGIGIVLNLLVGDTFYLEEARNDPTLCGIVATHHRDLLPAGYDGLVPMLDARAAQTQILMDHQNDPNGDAYKGAAATLDKLKPSLVRVTGLLHLEKLRRSVRRARWPLLACAVVGMLALTIFAWAANPAKPSSAQKDPGPILLFASP